MTNKNKGFWRCLKAFFNKKRNDIHQWNYFESCRQTFKLKVTEILYDAFMIIVENTSGKKSTGVFNYPEKISRVIDKTLESCKTNPSVEKNSGTSENLSCFSFSKVTSVLLN